MLTWDPLFVKLNQYIAYTQLMGIPLHTTNSATLSSNSNISIIKDTSIMPDTPEDQIEILTEERVDESGKRILVTRKILKKLVVHKVSKAVATRRQWSKFGDAKDHPSGPNTKTTLIGEDVFLRLSQNRDWDAEEKTDNILKPDKIKSITCRHCQGAHWTSKCPLRDVLPLMEATSLDTKVTSTNTTGNAPTNSEPSAGRYIPPSLRRGPGGSSGDIRNVDSRDESLPTIRVTNLSENARDSDLKDLFCPFGTVTRTFIARDHQTGRGKGFAFVTFTTKEAAALAIERVNRHAYDNLILKVEWANPSKP